MSGAYRFISLTVRRPTYTRMENPDIPLCLGLVEGLRTPVRRVLDFHKDFLGFVAGQLLYGADAVAKFL